MSKNKDFLKEVVMTLQFCRSLIKLIYLENKQSKIWVIISGKQKKT